MKPTNQVSLMPMQRKAMTTKHPRMAEIAKAQPPMWTPNGFGNEKNLGGKLA